MRFRRRSTSDAPRRRRQWGSDRRKHPLPTVPEPASDRALTATRLAIVVTVLGWAGYVTTTIIREFVSNGVQNMRFASEAVSYLVIVTLLTYSALAYLLTRLGYQYRTRAHRRVPRASIDEYFSEQMPTLTVIVPSYREDVRVVRQTLLSAALQEYPYLRIALLIDDPPEPTTREHRRILDAARALPGEIEALLREPRHTFESALEKLENRIGSGGPSTTTDALLVAETYDSAVQWLDLFAEHERIIDHSDQFFVDHVVRKLARDLELIARALRAAVDDGASLPLERLLQLLRRLAWTFRAELTSFERKTFASLSQEPNKAMNLNSYIGLMGGRFRIDETPDGRVLRPAPHGPADLHVADPDYILTLDADSVLLPEYCLRLVHLLEQPQHANVAVAQTPYSSFPGSSTRIERLAGATTDLQHISHQGMTYYDATFWVGANAVLRKAALDDIVDVDMSSGFEVRRYIQDRTVIEDTESSIDLGVHGWTLFNYPERLSYSATPPDFGSLCIQRQRWANGGLLILPKLWRHLGTRRRQGARGRVGEVFLRVNYMASIFWGSVGLVLLLAYPYSDRLLSPLVLGAALPYFFAMATDLKRCGYKRLDVLRIYGFNLVLLPVNLSGTLKSLGQGITGSKIAFARTPKVRDRTTAPASFVIVPYLLLAISVFTLVRDIDQGNWGHAFFAGTNATLCAYAIVAFIGLRHSAIDIWMSVLSRLYRSEKPVRYRIAKRRKPAVSARPAFDWATVLHHGSLDDAARSRSIAAPLEQAASVHQPTKRPHQAPARRTVSAESNNVRNEALARSLAQYFEALGQDDEVILRLDGPSVTITVQPAQSAQPTHSVQPAQPVTPNS